MKHLNEVHYLAVSFSIRLALAVVFVLQLGCASFGKYWKNLVSGGSAEQSTQSKSRNVGTTFNQQNNLSPSSYRKYKRASRKTIEDDAHLESRSGSLWVMEGQGAYLFSQNVVRMIGDPLAIRIDGDPADQLSSKAKVIARLQAQLEERRRRALGRAPAGEERREGEAGADNKTAAAQAPGAQAAGAPNPNNALSAQQNPGIPNPSTPSPSGDESSFSIKSVPTRVVERTVDGNYRVRGTQPFMIGQREYKVIVTGIVRAEDFNEDGVSASQLLDASYDIVSSKSTEMR